MSADTKTVDDQGRRVFDRDGHRIDWSGGVHDGADQPRGICLKGDLWQMDTTGYGTGLRHVLRHVGIAGWTNPGHFTVRRDALWHTGAHEASDKRVVGFNCSHGHFAPRGLAADPRRDRPLPACVDAATDAASIMQAMVQLTAMGWDFQTDNRIRCPDCLTEESTLDDTLHRLRTEAGKS